MEVILKQDVPNLGYANELVSVKPGFARNYLIPQGMAILATSTNKKILAENQKQQTHKAEKIQTEASDLGKKLENLVVKIGAKAAETGKIFGSVNAIQIAQALKEQHNFEIDRKKIHLDHEHVKEVGTYTAKINLHKDVSVEITFEVVAE